MNITPQDREALDEILEFFDDCKDLTEDHVNAMLVILAEHRQKAEASLPAPLTAREIPEELAKYADCKTSPEELDRIVSEITANERIAALEDEREVMIGMMVGGIFTFLVGMAVNAIRLHRWKQDAVDKGHAEYVLQDGEAVWRWKEAPTHKEPR